MSEQMLTDNVDLCERACVATGSSQNARITSGQKEKIKQVG